MSDQLNLFPPTTSGDSPECISLQASLFGTTPSPLPDGPPTAPSGPAPALADPSPAPAKEPRKTIQGIFGQTSFASSKHEDLSASLASRYRRLTASAGSTLYEITWTQRITPSGFSIPAQRAQGRPTSARGSIGALGWPTPLADESATARQDGAANTLGRSAHLAGWPTPNASNGSGGGQAARAGNPERSNELNDFAMLAGWPTPTNEDYKKDGPKVEARLGTSDLKTCDQRLRNFALLAGWPTPAARDWKSGEASQETLDQNARPLSEIAILSGWNTPRATDGTNGGPNQANGALSADAAMCGWATPKASDGDGGRTTMTKGGGNAHLQIETRLAGWPTPMAGTPAQNGNNAAGNNDSSRLTEALCRWPVPLTASGAGPIGFLLGRNGWETHPASGQLNPGHSRWLMGIPRIWCQCAIRASRSLKAKKRASSGSKDTVTGS